MTLKTKTLIDKLHSGTEKKPPTFITVVKLLRFYTAYLSKRKLCNYICTQQSIVNN